MRACSAVVKNASAWQLSGRRPQAVRIYYFDSHERLRRHLQLFLDATTMPGVLSRCVASPLTNTSAKPGLRSLISTYPIRPTPGSEHLRA